VPEPKRLRWVFTQDPIYFITAGTYNRRRILSRSDIHNSFIHFGSRAAERGVWIGRYVIMPDHIHLFAGFGPGSMSLSAWMKSFKNAISKTLTSATFLSPHWQKGFFDHVIRSQESLIRNGCTFEIILCELGWSCRQTNGLMRVK
jgi:REP element-mobilizing transposase RayT